jgi:hypothetical protein
METDISSATSPKDLFNGLLNVVVEDRDAAWEKAFLASLADAPISVLSPDAKEGPDHWPYLMVATEDMIAPAQADDSVRNVMDWLSTKGIGLVINPMKPMPDYVLPYGMIWNFRERGEFLTELPPATGGRFEITPGQKLWTGAPSEAYLPTYVRAMLKQFLADQGVFAPKVLMVNFHAKEESEATSLAGYDLCFSLESMKSPPTQEHANIAEALSWFLPAHYSVSLISEKTVPGFVSL